MLQFRPRQNQQEWERLVFAEVIIPDTPNAHGDVHSVESVREFAYGFMLNGFGIDTNHDRVDRTSDGYRIVESFIAREGDPDFIVGAWVVGLYVLDDDLWAQVLSGELNGFSYEALVAMIPVALTVDGARDITGETLPAVDDGHTHQFYARLNEDGNVIAGGTLPGGTDGHTHFIRSHTYTEREEEGGHRHRYLVNETGDGTNA